MSHEHHFLISFILDNQPQSRSLTHDGDTLDPGLAETLLKTAFPELKAATLSDVQVQKRTRHDEGNNTPGHYQQP
ncbi:hypothetical protein HU727_000475 [Pseudomonas sp. SWRI153]|uniref:Uncharacterized protein n=1 Tax=Pseudomonas khorasanensis TaxID=2745508 RepID=A0A923F401_9PSED|nr:hypothetical protein [Pseudomonas khorasanensis]MBV4484057.1 hypothetical protein [Pseudomonas khorasanensis]